MKSEFVRTNKDLPMTKFHTPKSYKIDFDAIINIDDLKTVLSSLASEVYIYDNIKDFDKVKKYLKIDLK